ncbi:MAG: amylo-alpha-1,6-glucosidase [Phycisphaerales bacterium]|nr:amylo-alpha-1,6-glucosidase [Phycisphaerales bacterium]
MTQDYNFVDRRRCQDLEGGRYLEWLVTNGRGGFGMGTVHQMLTRRYHGLLVAAVDPPVQRFVLLAKLEATVTLDGLTYELATNDYHEAVHPNGYKRLESFTAQPYPTWRWRTGDVLVEQTLCMVEGEDTTFVRYRLIEGERVMMTVRPLGTSRHFHHLTHYQDMGPPNVESNESLLAFHWRGDRPSWYLSHNGHFTQRSDWYYRYELALERERGYDASQDLFMPGPVTATLERGDPHGLVFAASTEQRSWQDHASVFAAASRGAPSVSGDQGTGVEVSTNEPLLEPLLRAASHFIVRRREDLNTVIAGYPWFGDWGRDTFVSLPGLCLVPGRFEEARKIIQAFATYANQGMLPNRFPPYGEEPVYDTADAALWFIHSTDRYVAYTGDWSFIAEHVYAVIMSILEAHEHGSRYGIKVDGDGLLAAGEPGFALTWMDARVSGRAITPRIGKPVDVNALWYNALRIGAEFSKRSQDSKRAQHWTELADRAQEGFNARFWNEEKRCLYDVVDVDGQSGQDDAAIRPNQLLAVSLTQPVLDESKWKSVVEVCEQQLWTPLGLRTLSPNDSEYRPRYEGDVSDRDQAYHQGTVWPWLLGPFVTGYVRAFGESETAKTRARAFLEGLRSHLSEAGLGGVSEVADGEPPHTPGGCPWQAWSVAEPLRVLCENILSTHPPIPREKQVPERVTTADDANRVP